MPEPNTASTADAAFEAFWATKRGHPLRHDFPHSSKLLARQTWEAAREHYLDRAAMRLLDKATWTGGDACAEVMDMKEGG